MSDLPSVQPLPEPPWSDLLERSGADVEAVAADVAAIVDAVRARGDAAVHEYTARFDGVDLDRLRVDDEAIAAARDELDPEAVEAIEAAAGAIDRFHERQRPESWIETVAPGVEAGTLVRPLDTVGCYAPGGAARYPSSVLMTAVPARVAGVDRVVACTPPGPAGTVDAATRLAADIAGVDDLFAIGGAQAIAAMAYGTASVPAVDKVVGPGNVYVTAAKREVMRDVDIDVLAGPTEVLIVADDSADPTAVAWDLVAQSEHDPDCASVLVSTDGDLAEAVRAELASILDDFAREAVVSEALAAHGRLLVADSIADAIAFANAYAPEHLQLMVADPEASLDDVEAAGTVFLGHATSTSAGDYAIGPSHVLPTSGAATRRSGISTFAFVRTPTVQRVTDAGLTALAPTIEALAHLEGLPGHAEAVRVRLEDAP
ncbi:MAG: histidinol dehydrogenase [Halobacteriales archaeon]